MLLRVQYLRTRLQLHVHVRVQFTYNVFTKVLSYEIKFESTTSPTVPSYEGTKVLSYFTVHVQLQLQLYESTTKVLSKYENSYESTKVLSYESTKVQSTKVQFMHV